MYTYNDFLDFQLITADGSPVSLPDQNATNGVIHVVSRVLFPIPLMNIPEEVTRDPRFSTLLTAVEKAELATTLAGKLIFYECLGERWCRVEPRSTERQVGGGGGGGFETYLGRIVSLSKIHLLPEKYW